MKGKEKERFLSLSFFVVKMGKATASF